MRSTRRQKKSVTALVAATAAVAAPAMLFLGAGTAHAYPSDHGKFDVSWNRVPAGLWVNIHNNTGLVDSACSYTSHALGVPFVPPYSTAFHMMGSDGARWIILSVPTGITWETDVYCVGDHFHFVGPY